MPLDFPATLGSTARFGQQILGQQRITMHRLFVVCALSVIACSVFLIRSPSDTKGFEENSCNFSDDTGMIDWLRGFFGDRTSAFCKQEFPQVRQ